MTEVSAPSDPDIARHHSQSSAPRSRRDVFFLLSNALFLLISIWRGIRLPNKFSFTHILYNYDYGFVRRGIVGATFRALGSELNCNYRFFVILSVAILVIHFYLLLRLCNQLSRKGWIGHLISLIFLSSMSIPFLSHTIGYIDHVGSLLTIAIIVAKRLRTKVLLMVFAFPLLLLWHEGMAVMFLPLCTFNVIDCLIRSRDSGLQLKWNKSLSVRIGATLALSAGLTLFAIVVNNSTNDLDDADRMYKTQSECTAIALRARASSPNGDFGYLNEGFHSGLAEATRLFNIPEIRREIFAGWTACSPVVLIFLSIGIFLISRMQIVLYLKYLYFFLFFVGGTSPLLLNVIAYDWHRWATVTILTSFLSIHIVLHPNCSIKKLAEDCNYRRILIGTLSSIAFVIVIINFIVTMPFFDNYAMHSLAEFF